MKIFIIDSLWLVIFSIILNGLLFNLINLGLLGLHLKKILNDLLKQRIYLIPIFSFLGFLLIKYHFDIFYLDQDEVIVTTTIGNKDFQISGEAITQICRNFGSATVFAVGARIASGLLAKHPMGLIPKVGAIGGTGAGFTITYRIILDAYNQGLGQSHGNISVSAPVKISLGKITHLDRNHNINDLLINAFNPDRLNYSTGLKFRQDTMYNFWTNKNQLILSDANAIENSKVLSTLEQFNPNWKDSFISSPLEPTDYILNTLSNNLLLNYIVLYLLIMLLIIISCKFVIREDIDTNTIKRFVFSELLSRFIKKYITIWQKSNILWIYLILISIIIFKIVSIFSISIILSILTKMT
jgi:hypothetical protein